MLIWVNTRIGLMCFLAAAPYIIWAAYAGNYATLAKGVRHIPRVSAYLEGIDTLLIGVCSFVLFISFSFFFSSLKTFFVAVLIALFYCLGGLFCCIYFFVVVGVNIVCFGIVVDLFLFVALFY